MIPAWSGTQIRAAEQPDLEAGRSPELMRRAAHGLALTCRRLLRERRGRLAGARVVVLAGKGSNGGDGLLAAADLRRAGAQVEVIATGDQLHADSAAVLRAAGALVKERPLEEPRIPEALELMLRADLVLDAMLGTGGSGGLRDAAAELAQRFERERGEAGPVVVAVDVPSGISADAGAVEGRVLRADATVTFAGAKLLHVLSPADAVCGELQVIPLGIEHRLAQPGALRLEDADLEALWPRPLPDDHKYTRGVVGIVAGSQDYPGAALLTVRSAQASGAGIVRYLGEEPAQRMVTLSSPEAVVSAQDPGEAHVQSWIAGPGAVDDAQRRRVAEVIAVALDQEIPAVLDAGALELVGQSLADQRLRPWIVLTPHAGEMASLLEWCRAWGLLPEGEQAPQREQIEADPGRWAQVAARATGATILLKGPTTILAAPAEDAPVIAVGTGSPWLATAGSGDTLAGMIGTLLAHDAGRPERLERALGPWLEGSGLPGHLRAQLTEALLGPGRWALLAGTACALQGRASRQGGEGPQPALPEDIRAALRAPGR